MKLFQMWIVVAFTCLWSGISAAGTPIVVDQQATQAQLQKAIDELNALKVELKKAPINKTAGPRVQAALDSVTALKVEIDLGGIPMNNVGMGVSTTTPAGTVGTSVVVQGPMGGQGSVVVQTTAPTTPVVQAPPPPQVVVVAPVVNAGPVAMDSAQLNKLVAAIEKESFRDDKMRVLTMGTRGQYLTVSQVSRLLEAFTFEDDKIEVVRLVAPSIIDKENAYQLYSAFTFSSSKAKVEEILEP